MHQIAIEWQGPFEVSEVIDNMNDEGDPPEYAGDDYGLYQIYGKHILCGPHTLLYIGKAFRETFSRRFRTHQREWLKDEEGISVYVGRIHDETRHSRKDNWKSWETDVALAENILIHKYSPNYNSVSISNKPDLSPHDKVCLVHKVDRHRLEPQDTAPDDYL